MAISATYSYRWMRIFQIALIICWSGLSWRSQATTVPRDVNTLRSLYKTWSGLSGWTGSDPCGDMWTGVICGNPDKNEVTQLKLLNSNLTGPIPPDIVNLASLKTLDLSFNPQLGGELPDDIGKLTMLQSLSIMSSGLTGSIPSSLGSCIELSFLSVTQNKLSGTIPAELGALVNLTWFDISENNIAGILPVSSTSGTVELGLDNLTNCQHFHFNNNSLVGSIPQEIFNLPNLVHLLLNGNLLQGTLPTKLANAKSLQILRVDSNQLSGTLPSDLNSLTTLIELYLSYNYFEDQLPDLSALTNLQLLDVSNNTELDRQPVPSWVYTMASVVTLNLDNCQLGGSLNSSVFRLPLIQKVQLSNNQFNGTLAFSGNSPGSLVLIDLQNNEFTGYTGFVSVNGRNSTVVPRLAGNPFCSESQFSGTPQCTPEESGLSSWAANSSNCKACGSGKTANPNDCSCSFPMVCSMQLTTPSFQTVNTSLIENLEGEFAEFYDLDVSQVYIGSANFTPDNRMLFDLQFFPLSGHVWSKDNETNIASTLNPPSNHLEEGPYVLRNYSLVASSGGSSKGGIGAGAIGGIVAGILAVALVGLGIVMYAIRQKRRADQAEVSRPFASWGAASGNSGDAPPQLKGSRWFSLAELRKATNNFHLDNEIGAGGYGKVYKGFLPSGAVVAVKKAEEGSMQGAPQFKNEIELLSRVHHKHLVGLVGFCYEQGEQMLVYEYIPNGTLRDHLLGHSELPLPWATRVSIALGSARGIAYLHNMANPPIIHRDIKSSNILLDEKMVAKVSDFGLSKLAPDAADKNHVSTQVKGTLGYLDPEYYMTNQLSEKSDVYSFGVVLLEILSARQPIERGRYIVREVRTAMDKGGTKALEPILDPLLGNYPQKELRAVIELALRCVEEQGADRPTMDEVVRELEVIAVNSQPTSGVHITVEPQKRDDPYGGEQTKNGNDPSFQYSAAYMPGDVEPK